MIFDEEHWPIHLIVNNIYRLCFDLYMFLQDIPLLKVCQTNGVLFLLEK